MVSNDEADLNLAARAILALESLNDVVEVAELAAHPSRHLRAAAAWFISHRPAPAPDHCRQLAGDSDDSVRAMLAGQLDALAQHDAAVAAELRRTLGEDRSARIRLRAAAQP
jgi:hypothetical protein